MDSFTGIFTPTFRSLVPPASLLQEAPGATVAVPIAAPYAGPGYEVTPAGVQDLVTGLTENGSAVQVADQIAYTFSVAAVTRWPLSVVPSEENWRNEFALLVPAS
ncbi:hypothetical protein EES39_07095 [Streptomyces sp. ADI92-24]|nr:hypothetical protein EES39_07095 [Streptomyces sp. ADI92-24]